MVFVRQFADREDPISRAYQPDVCYEMARAMLAADTVSEEDLAGAREKERQDYLYSHYVAQLDESGEYEKLCELIEKTPFLAAQIDYFEGFQASSRDLENFVLPAVIECADWNRFTHLALVALNFRGLADVLAEEEILTSLVRQGYRRLAHDIAAQLSEAATRARARAAVLAADPKAPDVGELLRQITDDLDHLTATSDEAAIESRFISLCRVAYHLGPRLHHRWADWIESLSSREEYAIRVWRAVAESWIRVGGWSEPGMRQALGAMGEPERIIDWLPRKVADSQTNIRNIQLFLEDLPFNDQRLKLHLQLALLARKAHVKPCSARESWERFAWRSIPWDLRLAELGRKLWLCLDAANLTALVKSIADAEVRAALMVISLEGGANVFEQTLVQATLEDLAGNATRLHWSLRYLAAIPAEQEREVKNKLSKLMQYLYQIHYGLNAGDLVRFLDLVAQYSPKDLPVQTENAIWSAASGPETLLTLASNAQTEELLGQLLANAESYAAAVSNNEYEGFELRREILIRLACGFACRWNDEESVERAAQSLLPGEEEDELRSTVVRELLDARNDKKSLPKRRALAVRICEAISSPRLALLARLQIALERNEAANLLDPKALYSALVDVDFAWDELQAVQALLDKPENPQELARVHLDQIRNGQRRIHGLLDLARHALRFQKKSYRPGLRDLASALQPLTEAVGGAAGDEDLVTLTPELVAVGAELGVHRAVAELQEASLRLFGHKQVDWSIRLQTFEILMANLGPLLFGSGHPGADRRSLSFLSHCRAAAGLIDWLMALPCRPGEIREELRSNWHEVLPLVVAAVERLPTGVELYLRYPLGARLCEFMSGWLHVDEKLCSRIERLLVTGWFRRRRATPWQRSGSELVDHWSWLEAAQRSVVLLSCQAARDRSLNAGVPSALVQFLSVNSPDRVRGLLRQLPDAEREETCLRLLRCHWLGVEQASLLLEMIAPPGVWRAVLWLGLYETSPICSDDWLRALASLLATGSPSFLDPESAPLRRHLWTIDEDASARVLAEATVEALRAHGRSAAENGLRFWLSAHLGSPTAEKAGRRLEKARAAIRCAESIPGEDSRVKIRSGIVEKSGQDDG